MSKIPKHYYMLTYISAFTDPAGRAGMKYTNVNIERPTKYIPLKIIGDGQQTVANELVMKGVSPDHIRDITLISVDYLGHMTEAQFLEGIDDDELKERDIPKPTDDPFAIKGRAN